MSIETPVLERDPVTPPSTAKGRGRIPSIDILRGMALIAMAVYHFSWDLENFGYLEPGTVGAGGWKLFARLIAGSFLFLAGFSLVLGHFNGIRWRAFGVRFAKIAVAALLITVVTVYVFPDSFIFFGILHAMAAASLIGLAFLKAPPLLTLAIAAGAFIAPAYLRSTVFDAPWLLWVGLSETLPRSNDYVPLLPWLAPFLTGLAAARLIMSRGLLARFARPEPSSGVTRILATGGRHSLAFYLVHQPVLFAVVYGAALVFPSPKPDPDQAFRSNCVATCGKSQPEKLCVAFCSCTLDQLVAQNLLEPLNAGQIDVNADERIQAIAAQCTLTAQTKE